MTHGTGPDDCGCTTCPASIGERERNTTTVTRRAGTGPMFPGALVVEWNPDFAGHQRDSMRDLTDANMRRHNAALRRHETGEPRPVPGQTHHDEWRILTQLEAITLQVRAWDALAAVPVKDDYLLSEYRGDLATAIRAAVDVATGLLDYPTGRLLCAEVSGYLCEMAEHVGQPIV